jgi:hypothetical protein
MVTHTYNLTQSRMDQEDYYHRPAQAKCSFVVVVVAVMCCLGFSYYLLFVFFP